MGQFKRKFQEGQAVILTNPSRDNKQYLNEEFTVAYFDGSNLPYRIHSDKHGSLWVKTKEISLADPSVPKRERVVPVDYNKLTFANMKVNTYDLVRVNFIPEVQLLAQLGVNPQVQTWVRNLRRADWEKYVGREGRVITTSGDEHIKLRFDNDPNTDMYFTALGLELIQRRVVVEQLNASSDYEATLYDFGVFVYNEIYTFDFFENLWKTIQEHKEKAKTGEQRRVDIAGRWQEGFLHRSYVQVGCQRFPYKNVEKLIEMIQVAKKIR